MQQAILTRHLHATNTRPTRIKAYCERGSVLTAYDHEGIESSHRKAIDALIRKFVAEDACKYGTEPGKNPWARPYVLGALPQGNRDSYAAVYLA